MNNFKQLQSQQPTTFYLVIIAIIFLILILVLYSTPYFIKQNKRYGTPLSFASNFSKVITIFSVLILAMIMFFGLSPYKAPPSDEIAIILGNTQNSPSISLPSDAKDAIISTMLQHKGEPVEELSDSIILISAVEDPNFIEINNSESKLKEIGNNSSNAKRNAEYNTKVIEELIKNSFPSQNGANYLEAIIEARNNVKSGSKIIVIGSGLSDSGELNFSKSNILVNAQNRINSQNQLKVKYGNNYLDGYNIEFYGLGDTVLPQEKLSNAQKEIVRDIYSTAMRSMGGNAVPHSQTLIGGPIETTYVVGSTDTGCGEIGLIFNDDNLKFVSNQAQFANETTAKETLMTIMSLWDTYSDRIQTIQIDGYIAHYAGTDTLSQQRSDLVKSALVGLGVPADKINAVGKGFGPYDQDSQNRMVKVTINRGSGQCEN